MAKSPARPEGVKNAPADPVDVVCPLVPVVQHERAFIVGEDFLLEQLDGLGMRLGLDFRQFSHRQISLLEP